MPRKRLGEVARTAMAAEGCDAEAELSVAIGDDRWIQRLNRRYLGRDAPTDVLAFPQEENPQSEEHLLGDVAISEETAAREAGERGHDQAKELELLLVHGILHLTGWRDETPSQRRAMMRRAEEVLSHLHREMAKE